MDELQPSSDGAVPSAEEFDPDEADDDESNDGEDEEDGEDFPLEIIDVFAQFRIITFH
jgi:hypothetical protein